ncbi:DUF4153 domain-containing protein [Roseovarius sp. SCSIO 43702]|uniref:DUF4153 domain-containing protein n=1 Tax=Roseovarius sp. SCSIO 43702 TaxID=2823043 RepID=UPI001C73AAB9|nr:DUF4153 domain-containing protein [Roseovarius sp. SCSIO 43702]QYX57928.1 DUF4153 domain-containing protein [Roseovarius sp. SCSIO 43702]
MSTRPEENVADRLSLAVVGAVAGVALYLLFDLVPEMVSNRRLVLLLATVGASFFAVLLALLGPQPLRRAASAAGALALPATALFVWASFRFDEPERYLESGHAVGALGLLLAIAAPFLASALEVEGGWRRYPLLFDTAWSIVVRYSAAGLFVGVVWAVLLLSDALLSLVGVTVIEDLIELDPVPWLISGIALGLGLAIVHELRDYISAFLFIQLLRVLLPLLLIVLVVFILALPIQGLSGLFGTLSPAATLAGVTLAAVTLISAVLHRDAGAEAEGRILRRSAQVLSVLIVVPASLAVYAVAVRIGQYGLTPDRIAAMTVALVILAYALGYAGSVVLRAGWMARMRRVNLGLALVTIAVAALWLTPVLNPERMSAASQLARAERGAAPESLPIWEFTHEWGRPGKRALAQLRAMEAHPQHERILALIGHARNVEYRYQFELEADGDTAPGLDGLIPVQPAGATLPEGALDGLSAPQRRSLREACARRLPGGGAGCVMVVADFDSRVEGRQAILFLLHAGGFVQVSSYHFRDDGAPWIRGVNGLESRIAPETMERIQAGEFSLEPSEGRVLSIGEHRLYPD